MENRIFTLKNGLKVVNFSSYHKNQDYAFKFTDGTLIPNVSPELCTKLMLEVEETFYKTRNSKYNNVTLDWILSETVADEIDYWFTFFAMKKVDIVLVPLPVMTALRSIWDEKKILKSPFRVIRVSDRITKAIHTDKFCI